MIITLETIKIIAVICTLTSIVLTIKNNILCWPIGIIGVLLYMVVYYENQIIMNTILQMVFIIQSIFGWAKWKQKVNNITKSNNWTLSISVSITLLMMTFLYSLNIIFKGNIPIFDSITTSISLTAMILTAYRKLEAWWFWMATNIFYILMFSINNEITLLFNYSINLILSIIGYLKWKNEYKLQKI